MMGRITETSIVVSCNETSRSEKLENWWPEMTWERQNPCQIIGPVPM